MKSLNKRIERLESQIICDQCVKVPCICENVIYAHGEEVEVKIEDAKQTFESKVAMLQHKVKTDRVSTELGKIRSHFMEGVAELDNIFAIVDHTIKYIELNSKKIATLLEVPVSGAFKKEMVLSFLDFSEEYIDQLIDFLVAKNAFPHKSGKKMFGKKKQWWM